MVYELLVGTAPFGYDNFSEEYLKKIKEGLTEEQLSKIKCPVTKDLIHKLMDNDIQKRLGSKGGFEEILEHEYFNCE